MAESAARKMAERAAGRPPPIMLLPFHLPDLRVNGATPIRLAILRRSRRPSSGTSARTLRAIVLPTPGKVTSRSSFSRQSGEDAQQPVPLEAVASDAYAVAQRYVVGLNEIKETMLGID